MDRKAAEAAYWRATHRDFKGTTEGVKTVMVYRNGSTLVPLSGLTDKELADRVKDYRP